MRGAIEPVVASPKILILGVGGIGGYFGGRLAEGGADVTFLVRENRRAVLAAQGLKIESPFGDAKIAIKTLVERELTPTFDAIILACKAYDLDGAIDAVGPALAPTGYVLPFLNGVAHIDVLNYRFGRSRVLGGTAKSQSTLLSDGTVKQFNDWRTLTIGEQAGEISERLKALAGLYERSKGVEVLVVTDIMQRMWDKIVHLSTAATMTCLMRANVDEILRTPDGQQLFLEQLQTGAAIAAANGYQPNKPFMESWTAAFSQSDSQYSTSMLRDIERGGRTEVDHVLGYMLAKAREANIPHKTLQLAYTHIKAFEQRREAGGLPQ